MGFLSFLAGDSNAVDKVVDAGVKGLDALVFTEEERAEYHKKLQDTYLEFVKIAATESTAQSVSRRLICMPVVYVWLLLVCVNVVVSLFFPDIDTAIISESIGYMNTPALAAIGFYTGRHIVSEWKAKK